MPFLTTPRLSIVGDKSFRLEDDLVYSGSDGNFTVTAGFVTDFATVPQIIQWLIPTYGKYTLAAILHDDLCVKLADYHFKTTNFQEDKLISKGWVYRDGEGLTPPEGLTSSPDTDGIFRRVMRELGVSFCQRWLMWAGVRWGAIFNRARRRGSLQDLHKLLLVSILAAPFVAPVTIVVIIGLAVTGIVNRVFRFLK